MRNRVRQRARSGLWGAGLGNDPVYPASPGNRAWLEGRLDMAALPKKGRLNKEASMSKVKGLFENIW